MIRIIYEFNTVADCDVFNRAQDTFNVEEIVTEIIETVKSQKDAALLAYTEKFDQVVLNSLQVSEEEITEAFQGMPIVLVTSGLMAIAFFGFSGVI